MNLGNLFLSALHNATSAAAATIVPVFASIQDPTQILSGGALAAVQHNPTLALFYGLAFMVARDALARAVPAFAGAAGKTTGS